MKEKTLNIILIISLGTTSFAGFLVAIVIFYKSGVWNEAIAAGFIGFFGAIIGGTITLVGVNKTIESNNLNRKLNDAPKQLKNIAHNIRFLMELWEQYESIGMDPFQKPNETYKNSIKLISNSNFIELSASISPKVYKKTTDFQYSLVEKNLKFNQQIEPYHHSKYYNYCKGMIFDLIKVYREEEKELLKIISEY